jgi:hypothetical protein
MDDSIRQATQQRHAPKLRPLPGALSQSLGQNRHHARPDGGVRIRLIAQGVDALLPGLRQLPQVHTTLARTNQCRTHLRRQV